MKDIHKYAKVFLFVLMLGLGCQGFAVQDSKIPDNYYVQPGGIFIAPNGMYASIDGNLIQIYALRADEKGIFVPIEEIIAGNLEYCPFCQSWYDPDDPRGGHSCSGPRD